MLTRNWVRLAILCDAVVESLEVVLGLVFEPGHCLRCEGRSSIVMSASRGQSMIEAKGWGAGIERPTRCSCFPARVHPSFVGDIRELTKVCLDML
jgi:hypothetical protein